jgi:hypothetical protein
MILSTAATCDSDSCDKCYYGKRLPKLNGFVFKFSDSFKFMFRVHKVNQVIVEKIMADLKKPFVYWLGKKDFSLFGMATTSSRCTSQIFRQAQTVLNQNLCSSRRSNIGEPYPVTTSHPAV